MTLDWTALDAELDVWRAGGLTLPFWWRDDDAVEGTPDLDRLLALSARCNVPLHLAVIPAHVRAELVAASGDAIVLVHGWAHANHSAEGEKSCEHPNPGSQSTKWS